MNEPTVFVNLLPVSLRINTQSAGLPRNTAISQTKDKGGFAARLIDLQSTNFLSKTFLNQVVFIHN